MLLPTELRGHVFVDVVGVEPTPTVLETAVLAVTPHAHMWSHRRDTLSPFVCDSKTYISVVVFIVFQLSNLKIQRYVSSFEFFIYVYPLTS